MMTTQRHRLTEPLGSVTAFFGSLLMVAVLAGIVVALTGSGSVAGLGRGPVCVTQPGHGYSDSQWTSHLGVSARPGGWLTVNGTVQACAAHPGFGQRALLALMNLPVLLLWGCVLFLLWRLLTAARRTGPFTIPAAAAMRLLGWVIIVGSVVAAAIQGFATDQLLNTLLTTHDFPDVINGPLHALLPVPVLAGAALLTFARVVRLGADMDDEIKGTV